MRALGDLARDEKGNFLVFFALSLIAFLGMMALAFDLGRVGDTQTDLQSFADSMALAAAAELDGKDTSIDLAIQAAQTLVTDTQTFADDGRDLTSADVTLTFLKDLPDDDSATDAASDVLCTGAACASLPASKQRAALFVRVDVTPQTVAMSFASALGGLTGAGRQDAKVGATATAGNTQYACAITPMMFCLPSATYRADANIGDQIILRSGGNGAAWGPGDFGFLDPTSLAVDPNGPCGASKLSGRNLWSCLVGADGALTQCVVTRGQLMTEPGQRNGVAEAAFNVRFDIYRATMGGEANQAAYAPAPNVIKGSMRSGGPTPGNTCLGMNNDPTVNTMALPRDACLIAGTCGRVGDGTWDRAGYVALNHNGTAPTRAAGAPAAEARYAGTRYQMYLDEIYAASSSPASSVPLVPAASPGTASAATRWSLQGSAQNPSYRAVTETGRPSCSSHQSSDPDRRVIIAAGVDCTANPVSGNSPIAVTEFFRIFLTEPARDDGASPPNVDIAGEIIGSAGITGGGNGGVFREVVQLYR